MSADARKPFDAARHLDAMAATLDLAITDQQRPGVLLFLEVAHQMAQTVATAPLPDDAIDLAPAFRPRGPGEMP